MADVICIGMALVDSIIRGFQPEPVSASGYIAESCTLSSGGEAVNAAVALAKLGTRAGILCALGEDAAGGMVRETLERAGVDQRLILRAPMTPVTTLFVREDGSRRSITNGSHRLRYHPEEVDFSEARAVVLGSLFRAPFDDPETVLATVQKARAAGQLVFADTKLPNFTRLTLADLREALPMIDYITPNEDEARYFTGRETPEEMADALLGYGVKNAVIKLGGQGCFLKNAQGSLRIPALPVHAVDSTGAGDHFLAGLVSEILRGSGTEEALRFANACGAVCVTAVGAGGALKNREQVLALLSGSPA